MTTLLKRRGTFARFIVNKMNLCVNSRLVSCLLLAVILAVPSLAGAQKGGGGGQQTGNQQGGNQQGGNQQGSNQNQNGSPQGITGGSSPIEATLFSYSALDADASRIAHEIDTHVHQPYVVTTANDISVILQWRTVIAQAEGLQKRLDRAQDALVDLANDKLLTSCNINPTVQANSAQVGAGYTPSGADLQAVAQTIASITAVNQTLAPSAGNMTDLPLMNLVAGYLHTAPVFIPSLLPPNLLMARDLGDGPLSSALTDLEVDLGEAQQVAATAADRLADWQTVSNSKAGVCSTGQVATATALVNRWKPASDSLTAAITAVDAFESSLFSGQSPPSPSTQPSPNAATPALTPTPPLSPGSPSPAQSGGPSGSTLQQILAADLLYQALMTEGVALSTVHFIEVHSLESGGGLLTKSNAFLGSRLYFGGGAVATFTVFNYQGVAECGGVAYSYQGYVKPEDVARELEGSQLRTVLKGNCHLL